MGEILGIGMTHAPHLQFTDENMANVLRRLLKSERTPEAMSGGGVIGTVNTVL